MKVSVIVINYNTWPTTSEAIRTFFAMEKDLQSEVILIDNGSDDIIDEASVKALGIAKFIKNNANLGFAKAVNQGMSESHGDFIFLMNSDVFIKDGAVSRMLRFLEANPGTGIIGPRFVYPDGKFQISAGTFPSFMREMMRLSLLYKLSSFKAPFAADTAGLRDVDWVSGGAMLFQSNILKDTGGLDENYFFGNEDIDFCYQARKSGWRTAYLPAAEVVHHHGLSSGGKRSVFRAKLEKDSLIYFFKKNAPLGSLRYLAIRGIYGLKIAIFKLMGL